MAPQRQSYQPATEYRLQITLPNRTVTITSMSEDQCKSDIEALLQSKPKFEQHGNATWVFHNHFMNGEEPIGVILKNEVPEALSIQRVVEQRLRASAGA